MRRRDGFSLIELLVVILIIGILATVAIPRFVGQRDAAHGAEAKTALKLAQKTIETYYWQHENGFADVTDANLIAKLNEIEPGLQLQLIPLGSAGTTVAPANPDASVVYVQRPHDTDPVRWQAPIGAFTPEGYTYTIRFDMGNGNIENIRHRYRKNTSIGQTYNNAASSSWD